MFNGLVSTLNIVTFRGLETKPGVGMSVRQDHAVNLHKTALI